jgi:hypothetical protein
LILTKISPTNIIHGAYTHLNAKKVGISAPGMKPLAETNSKVLSHDTVDTRSIKLKYGAIDERIANKQKVAAKVSDLYLTRL